MPYYSTDRFFAQAWHLRPYQDVPLSVAVELADVVSEACRWFHDPKHIFLGDAGAPPLSDEAVEAVCDALQHQLDKEGESRTRGAVCTRHGVAHTSWYHLTDLPMPRKRALAERVWALRQQHSITVRVWEPDDPVPPSPTPPFGGAGSVWP